MPNIINKQPNSKINANTYINSNPNNLPNNYYTSTPYTNTLFNNYSKPDVPTVNYNLPNTSYHYPNA